MLWPIFQRYNLKAIHNASAIKLPRVVAVTNISKIQSESNSQLCRYITKRCFSCDQYFKDTIWKQFTTCYLQLFRFVLLWPIFQRYNLKAIHNTPPGALLLYIAVTNISKIQSESNSQLGGNISKRSISCDQYFKDTIWKQFTTITQRTIPLVSLWPIFQRYNLKAIHNLRANDLIISLLWPIFQRYNLKAIHNSHRRARFDPVAVTNISKIQSESNSQRMD